MDDTMMTWHEDLPTKRIPVMKSCIPYFSIPSSSTLLQRMNLLQNEDYSMLYINPSSSSILPLSLTNQKAHSSQSPVSYCGWNTLTHESHLAIGPRPHPALFRNVISPFLYQNPVVAPVTKVMIPTTLYDNSVNRVKVENFNEPSASEVKSIEASPVKIHFRSQIERNTKSITNIQKEISSNTFAEVKQVAKKHSFEELSKPLKKRRIMYESNSQDHECDSSYVILQPHSNETEICKESKFVYESMKTEEEIIECSNEKLHRSLMSYSDGRIQGHFSQRVNYYSWRYAIHVITDVELMQKSMKELNEKFSLLPRAIVDFFKARRRSLRNRIHAQTSRNRSWERRKELELRATHLCEELEKMREELNKKNADAPYSQV